MRGDLGAAMVDLTEGAAELVVFGGAGAQARTIQEQDAELTDIATRSARTAGIGLALTTLLAGLASWGCLLAGIPAVSSGRLDGTELAVITLIPLAAFELVVGLPVATQALQRVRQAAARVFEVTDAVVPVPDPEVALPVPEHFCDLEAVAVWATYPGATGPVLRGVDLSLTAGKRVAVVGPSGAGKSTLAAVLLRFLPWQSGSLTLGGTPIDRLTPDDLRTVVGMVGQDAYLFDTTIAENLRVGRRTASDAELAEVVARVGLASWLGGLPRGLDTEVGGHGARLSGGQRQRLAVARALLADLAILVLDEPAEHLDPAAADALTADLLEVTDGRTLILITHRLVGLESVDEILVMDEGRVVERGTHDQLLAVDGRYSHLWWEEMRTARYPSSEDLAMTDLAKPSQADQSQTLAAVPEGGLNDGSPTS